MLDFARQPVKNHIQKMRRKIKKGEFCMLRERTGLNKGINQHLPAISLRRSSFEMSAIVMSETDKFGQRQQVGGR